MKINTPIAEVQNSSIAQEQSLDLITGLYPFIGKEKNSTHHILSSSYENTPRVDLHIFLL